MEGLPIIVIQPIETVPVRPPSEAGSQAPEVLPAEPFLAEPEGLTPSHIALIGGASIESLAWAQADEIARLQFEETFRPYRSKDILNGLPAEGFESEAERERLVDDIVAVGLPVDNYRTLASLENNYYDGTQGHLGRWGVRNGFEGQFAIFKLLDRELPEHRLLTVVHESAHANTPLLEENAYLFGGEAERAEAARYAEDLAGQSLLTGKYLNYYHAYNARLLEAGRIDHELFVEETQAIATQMGLTDREELARVEAEQQAEAARLLGRGEWSSGRQPVSLLSKIDEQGRITVAGIDKQLIRLVRGVEDYQGLIRHTQLLDQRPVNYSNYSKRQQREAGREWVIHLERRDGYDEWAAEMKRRLLDGNLAIEPNYGRAVEA